MSSLTEIDALNVHTELAVTEILEAVADRAAIEQTFHDLKEVGGFGQAQLRNVWANVW